MFYGEPLQFREDQPLKGHMGIVLLSLSTGCASTTPSPGFQAPDTGMLILSVPSKSLLVTTACFTCLQTLTELGTATTVVTLSWSSAEGRRLSFPLQISFESLADVCSCGCPSYQHFQVWGWLGFWVPTLMYIQCPP